MNKGTVLVVDDDKMTIKLIKSVLQFYGKYEVLEALSAEEGIEIAFKYKPDIVLMDIELPGIDGLSATQLIKSNPELKEIPVIAVTQFDMLTDEQKSLSAGCVGHISKPIDVKTFIDTMEAFIA